MDISKILDKNGKISSMKLPLNKLLVDELTSKWKVDTVAEAVFLERGGEVRKCENCQQKTSWNRKEYSRFCSVSCASKITALRGADHHLSKESTRKKIKETNIKKYGVQNPMSSEEIKKKRMNTCLSKYGSTSFLGSCIGKEKRDAGMLSKYGVLNISSDPNIQILKKENSLLKYGVDHPGKAKSIIARTSKAKITNTIKRIISENSEKFKPLFDEQNYTGCGDDFKWECLKCSSTFFTKLKRASVIRCLKCDPRLGGSSKIEQGFSDWVSSLGIEVHRNKRNIISPLELDLFIPSKKVAIEINGNYWHSLGEDNSSSESFKHLVKLEKCQEQGIKLIQIFEDELLFKEEIIKSRIRASLGFSTKIFARKLKIVQLEKSVARKFFDKTHLQGFIGFNVGYGLQDTNGDIVCAAIFGTPRFDKGSKWELLRFSSALNTSCVGALSRIMKHFTGRHEGSIISYANRLWGDGVAYEKVGFTKVSTSAPSFSYVHKSENYLVRYNRLKFQKHKLLELGILIKDGQTAKNAMFEAGYRTLWDCGTTKWVLGS
jgi:hypothetical protein